MRIGDVLLYGDSEYWLAGEIALDEEGFALRLFTSPGGRDGSHVVQLDPEAKEIAFLRETTEVPAGRVPVELPIAGYRLALWKRGQADVATSGEHLPPTTMRAEYILLGGPGGRLLLVLDFVGGDRVTLFGERVMREAVDLLPGGDSADHRAG
jgi:hypothetical protein